VLLSGGWGDLPPLMPRETVMDQYKTHTQVRGRGAVGDWATVSEAVRWTGGCVAGELVDRRFLGGPALVLADLCCCPCLSLSVVCLLLIAELPAL
jgi:hypothetical protein